MPHAALTMKLAEKEAPVGYVSRVTDSREGGFPSECILGTHSRAAPKVGEENQPYSLTMCGWSRAAAAASSSTLRPSDERVLLYNLSATGAEPCEPDRTALCTTPEVPSPRVSSRSKLLMFTVSRVDRGSGSWSAGFPASASHERTGSPCTNQWGILSILLLARRSNSSERIARTACGTASRRLLASINFRILTNSSIWIGRSAS
mmetsp:Transcript_11115/g.34309  ORF Transcript_11115/g.34309 Transcript_11115/m.34309 type:complete len:205 (+) Transcript_11115:563-1177(+)